MLAPRSRAPRKAETNKGPTRIEEKQQLHCAMRPRPARRHKTSKQEDLTCCSCYRQEAPTSGPTGPPSHAGCARGAPDLSLESAIDHRSSVHLPRSGTAEPLSKPDSAARRSRNVSQRNLNGWVALACSTQSTRPQVCRGHATECCRPSESGPRNSSGREKMEVGS